MRRRFCAGVTWAQDHSSYNVSVSHRFPSRRCLSYADISMAVLECQTTIQLATMTYTFCRCRLSRGSRYVFILYLLRSPAHDGQWWSTNQTYPHHSLTCNVIDNSQMIIMGGTFPNASSTQCDAQVNYGMHNLNLGKQNEEDAMWYYFLPNVTSYQVPPEITKAVGGGYVSLRRR